MFRYILLIPIVAASYTDWKWRKIPITLFPGFMLAFCVYNCLSNKSWNLENYAGFFFMFIPLLVLCFTGKMGGGDLIMLSVTGFVLGANGIPIMCCSMFVLAVIWCLLKKITLDSEIPIAPVVLPSYVISIIYLFWRGL